MLAAILLLATACAKIAKPSGWSGPLVAGDLVLVSDSGVLSALELKEGTFTLKWRFPPEGEKEIKPEGIYGTPVVAGEVVYFGAYNDNVYALALSSGEPVWDGPFPTGGPLVGGVALGEGTVYAASDDGNLYAIDAASGGQKDSFDAGDSIWAPPLYDQGTVYVATLGGKLFALDAKTLDELWDKPFEAEAGLVSTPVLADKDTLLVGGIDRQLYAVEAATGRLEWRFEADNWFWTQPLVEGGIVYAGSLDGNVYALELASGEPAWDKPFAAQSPIRAAPVLVEAAGVLVVADRSGNLYGLDHKTGELKWGSITAPIQLGEAVLSNPIPTDEGVLVSTQGGRLFLIDPEDGSPQPITVRES